MNVLGPHQDKTQDLVPGSSIVSISLGATRTFRISKKEGGKKIKVKDYELTNGTVIIMRKEMQDKYYHEIVKVNGEKGKKIGPRINITFRKVKGVQKDDDDD